MLIFKCEGLGQSETATSFGVPSCPLAQNTWNSGVEGVITGLRGKGEATEHYIQRKSLNGNSPFTNWLLDTYSDVGLLDWYRYSIDLNEGKK